MESFGNTIRKLRKKRGLLLREAAAMLDIDPSFLSRIEKDVKAPTKEHVVRLASILATDENELMIAYLSDKIVYELKGEKLAREAITIAEKKIGYRTAITQSSIQPEGATNKNYSE